MHSKVPIPAVIQQPFLRGMKKDSVLSSPKSRWIMLIS